MSQTDLQYSTDIEDYEDVDYIRGDIGLKETLIAKFCLNKDTADRLFTQLKKYQNSLKDEIINKYKDHPDMDYILLYFPYYKIVIVDKTDSSITAIFFICSQFEMYRCLALQFELKKNMN